MRLYPLFPPPVPAPSSPWLCPRSWLGILPHHTSQALQPEHKPSWMGSGDNSDRATMRAVPGVPGCRLRSLRDQWHLLQ